MTTAVGPSVSILWLWTAAGSPVERFESFAKATDSDIELLLCGSPLAEAALAALPQRFARQRVVLLDTSHVAAAINHAAGLLSSSFIVIAPALATPSVGWIEALLLCASASGADAVTPRLVAANGRMAASGSLLWRDGTCEPFGTGEAASDMEHAFQREVPAAPAAGLCLRRTSLVACGGMDAEYASAEYAIADLCMRLRDNGGRVVYQPLSKVEWAPSAPASAADAATRAADRDRFVAEWRTALDRFPVKAAAVTIRVRLAARDALCSERLLVVDDRVPGADRGSGDPRMLRLLVEIVTLWPSIRLTLVALRPIEPERYAPALMALGVEVIYGAPDWDAWFTERNFHYGAVMISRPQPIDPLIRRTQPQAFRIYDAEAFVFRRIGRQLPFIADRAQAREMANQLRGVRDAETEYLASSDLVLCVSHEERRASQAIAEAVPVVVIPHRIDVMPEPPGFAAREGLLYFGGFMAGSGSPNEDALMYLIHEILPLLHAEEPQLMLYVVGADPTPAVRAVASDRIQVVGYVPDSGEWLSRVRVHLAPMRFGSGVKLKLIDTMAAGLPFVTTRVGAEGLRLGPLRRAAVAETPEALARLTLDLYRDEALWNESQRALLSLAERHFSRDRFRRSLTTAMTHVGLAPPDLSGAFR